MWPTGQKHSKFWCLDFTKLQFLEKICYLVHFRYSFPKSLFFGIIYENFSKHFKKYPTPSNQIVDSPTKHKDKDGFALSFATKYYYRATYHLNVEASFFAIE